MKDFKIKPIKNEVEYKATLKELEKVWHAKPNTNEGDIFELLVLIIEKYETEHFAFQIPKINPNSVTFGVYEISVRLDSLNELNSSNAPQFQR